MRDISGAGIPVAYVVTTHKAEEVVASALRFLHDERGMKPKVVALSTKSSYSNYSTLTPLLP